MRQVSIHNQTSDKFRSSLAKQTKIICDYNVRADLSNKLRDYIYESVRFPLLTLVKLYTK